MWSLLYIGKPCRKRSLKKPKTFGGKWRTQSEHMLFMTVVSKYISLGGDLSVEFFRAIYLGDAQKAWGAAASPEICVFDMWATTPEEWMRQLIYYLFRLSNGFVLEFTPYFLFLPPAKQDYLSSLSCYCNKYPVEARRV